LTWGPGATGGGGKGGTEDRQKDFAQKVRKKKPQTRVRRGEGIAKKRITTNSEKRGEKNAAKGELKKKTLHGGARKSGEGDVADSQECRRRNFEKKGMTRENIRRKKERKNKGEKKSTAMKKSIHRSISRKPPHVRKEKNFGRGPKPSQKIGKSKESLRL